jgi:sulfatase maturation enzyme AslB (radical SAM superfamily)
MAPRVFAVPVFDKWLVFAPLDRVAALVSRAALTEFPGELAVALAGEPEPEPRPREGPVEPQFLGLVPTRACNLSCAYCGFGATPHGEQMDPRLAAAGVDWMAEYAARNGRGTLDVHFFGGEPFAAPDVVDVALHRTRAVAAEKGMLPHLEVATNGVYNEARARWVGDYFDAVVLSFDGFRAVHDRHRPAAGGRGSFDQVASTARVLSASPADTCLRVCVAQDNVAQLAETVAWFSGDSGLLPSTSRRCSRRRNRIGPVCARPIHTLLPRTSARLAAWLATTVWNRFTQPPSQTNPALPSAR